MQADEQDAIILGFKKKKKKAEFQRKESYIDKSSKDWSKMAIIFDQVGGGVCVYVCKCVCVAMCRGRLTGNLFLLSKH